MKVQAIRGHPRASVGVLFSPRGVDESQSGSCVPVVWKRWTKASRYPGWLVFIGALVEALPHRRRPRVVVVGEGVVRPVVPMPRRRVRHRQAARVAVL